MLGILSAPAGALVSALALAMGLAANVSVALCGALLGSLECVARPALQLWTTPAAKAPPAPPPAAAGVSQALALAANACGFACGVTTALLLLPLALLVRALRTMKPKVHDAATIGSAPPGTFTPPSSKASSAASTPVATLAAPWDGRAVREVAERAASPPLRRRPPGAARWLLRAATVASLLALAAGGGLLLKAALDGGEGGACELSGAAGQLARDAGGLGGLERASASAASRRSPFRLEAQKPAGKARRQRSARG